MNKQTNKNKVVNVDVEIILFSPDPGTWGEDGGRGLAKSDSDVSMASAIRLSASEACLELEDIRLEDRRVGVERLDMGKD